MTFSDLGLDDRIVQALEKMGIRLPTSVQHLAIPPALHGRNLMVESETGSGKTLAFLAPILQSIDPSGPRFQALVLAPTRELASQTQRVFDRLCRGFGIPVKSALVLGGASPKRQEAELSAYPQIVFGTVGRVLQFARIGKIDLGSLKIMVLDEADRLMAAEAREETMALMGMASAGSSTWLYSATLDSKTEEAAKAFAPEALVIRDTTREALSGLIEHWCLLADRRDRLDLIRRLDKALKPSRALLFTHSSGEVLNALAFLREAGLPIEALHGDFDGERRLQSLELFRSGSVRWLVTSDLGARGLDIESVSHVLMLDSPDDERAYVHRAGRTGRNGQPGVCIALADSWELKRLSGVAGKLGISFKAKRLYEGSVCDITLEEFFGHAEDMAHDRRKRRKQGSSRGKSRGNG